MNDDLSSIENYLCVNNCKDTTTSLTTDPSRPHTYTWNNALPISPLTRDGFAKKVAHACISEWGANPIKLSKDAPQVHRICVFWYKWSSSRGIMELGERLSEIWSILKIWDPSKFSFGVKLAVHIMQETVLIWKLLCFTYILALVYPVPEKIPIGKSHFCFFHLFWHHFLCSKDFPSKVNRNKKALATLAWWYAISLEV